MSKPSAALPPRQFDTSRRGFAVGHSDLQDDGLQMEGTFQLHGRSVLHDSVVVVKSTSDAPFAIGVRHGWRHEERSRVCIAHVPQGAQTWVMEGDSSHNQTLVVLAAG